MDTQTVDLSARDAVLAEWEAAKVTLEVAKEREMSLRKAAMAACFPDAREGTNRAPLYNGFEVKAVRKVNHSLADYATSRPVYDRIAKLGNEGPFLAERLLKFSVDLSVSEYKKLLPDNPTHVEAKKLIDAILTTKDGAPTLEIVPPKSK